MEDRTQRFKNLIETFCEAHPDASPSKLAMMIRTRLKEGLISPVSQVSQNWIHGPLTVYFTANEVVIEDATKKNILEPDDMMRAPDELQELASYLSMIASDSSNYDSFVQEFTGWTGEFNELLDDVRRYAQEHGG